MGETDMARHITSVLIRSRLGIRRTYANPIILGSPEHEKIFGRLVALPKPKNKEQRTGAVDDSEVLFRIKKDDDSSVHEPTAHIRELSENALDEGRRRAEEAKARKEQEMRLRREAEEARKKKEAEEMRTEAEKARETAQKELRKTQESMRREAEKRHRQLDEAARERRQNSNGSKPPAEDQSEGTELETSEIEIIERYQIQGIPNVIELTEFILPSSEVEGLKGMPEGRRFYVSLSSEGCEILGKKYLLNEKMGKKSIAKFGSRLLVWPNEMTSEAFLDHYGISAREYDVVKWPERFIGGHASEEDYEHFLQHLPEERVLFIHPVPEADTKNSYNLKVLRSFADHRSVTINNREYYVVRAETVQQWKELVQDYPQARICSRSGRRIDVTELNGHGIFRNKKTSHLSFYGKAGPPLPVKAGYVQPYESEMAEIYDAYDVGLSESKVRYLYPIGDLFSKMPMVELVGLVRIANKQLENDEIIPLISLHGRWYFVFDKDYMGSRKTMFEDRKIKVFARKADNVGERLQRMRDEISRRTESLKPEHVSLPTSPSERVPLINALPEGKPRWLQEIPPDNVNLQIQYGLNIVCLTDNGQEPKYFIVHDEPYPRTIKVVRNGNKIEPV